MKISSFALVLAALLLLVSCTGQFSRGGVSSGTDPQQASENDPVIKAPNGIWFSSSTMTAYDFEGQDKVTKYIMDGPVFYTESVTGTYKIDAGKITLYFEGEKPKTYSLILDGRKMLTLSSESGDVILTPMESIPEKRNSQ